MIENTHPTTRRARGLDALIPTSPDPAPTRDAPDAVRQLQWRELEAALFAITNAQFEYERNRDDEAGRMWVEDARRALGTLALSLADGPADEGYARLFSTIMTEPNVRSCRTAPFGGGWWQCVAHATKFREGERCPRRPTGSTT